MYRKDKRRTAALYIAGAVAFAACFAVVALLVFSMVIRNQYRAMCLEINDAILSTPIEDCAIGRDGEFFPADAATLDYYDRFLLYDGTTAFNRRAVEPEHAIVLRLGDSALYLTGTDNGTAVNLRWVTPEQSRSFTVRADNITYAQIRSYYVNYSNRLSKTAG